MPVRFLPIVPPGFPMRASAMLSLIVAAACSPSDAVGPGGLENVPVDAARKPRDGGTTTTPVPTPTPAPSTNALGGMSFYVSPTAPATRQADLWRATRPADADLMAKMGAQPVATWLAEWSGDITSAVSNAVGVAASSGRTALLVAYNIPYRDCGSYSAGGLRADSYRTWIRGFAAGLGGRRAVVILEPDAVAGASCLSSTLQDERFALLSDAVTQLTAAGALVYVDAGHPRWLSYDTVVARLLKAGVAQAQGFALNVSNFVTTAENVTYGDEISRRLAGKRYVIDTSRNGLGPDSANTWCNPSGRALGQVPTTQPSYANVDALLWIKVPGESDGTCNGGPGAGTWWADYALGLAQRSTLVM